MNIKNKLLTAIDKLDEKKLEWLYYFIIARFGLTEEKEQ